MTQNIDRRSRLRAALVAALLAAVAMILATTLGTRPAEAAFPGENGKIVFEGLDLNTWNYEIYGVGADGSNPAPLTDDPAEDRMPVLSPDGTKIAFASNRDGAYALYVMGSDGSNPTRLTNDPGMEDSQPSWSPDGKKLVFLRTITVENNPEIYLVDAEGSNPTRLTENPSFDSASAFSPDGSKIAFMSLRDGDSEVFIMGPDGSGQTNLTDNDSSDYDPAFSPAGDKIAFSSDRDGDPEIYTMDAANGANPTRLTDSPTVNADPDWQPLRDTVPPTVSNATPTGTAVKGNAFLTATFSEEMNRATIAKGTFKVFKVNPDRTTTRITNVAVSLSANGLKAKLDPYGTSTTLLPANTKYKAVVTTRAKDLADNPLAKNFVCTFTTGSR